MYCLKCGNAIRSPEVFCPECLADMDTCPVRADAVIQIPNRPAPVVEKASRKKKQNYADYIRVLRRLIRWLCVAVAALTLLVCLLGFLLFQQLQSPADAPSIGKNYTTTEQSGHP